VIDLEILDYSLQQLIDFIRYEAGCSSPEYFLCQASGGLELQQVPEEYAQLLLWLKSQHFKDYLELGIGRGGSFLLNTLFQPELTRAWAVDNCEYWQQSQKDDIQTKIDFIKNQKQADIRFINSSTDDFFATNLNHFDCIFIDADHSYEGVIKDYENALKFLKPGGYLIFHDINSQACPGVGKMWREVANKDSITFVASTTCGIGIVRIEDAAYSYSYTATSDSLATSAKPAFSMQKTMALAFERLNSGDLASANNLCHQLLTEKIDNFYMHYLLCLIAERSGNIHSAHTHLQEALAHGEGIPAKRFAAAGDLLNQLEKTLEGMSKKYHLIKAWGCGFFSDVYHILGQLLIAELTGRIPVVYWGDNSCYSDHSQANAFEIFFQPVSSATISDVVNCSSFFPPKWNKRNIMHNNINRLEGDFSRLPPNMFFERPEEVLVSDFFNSIESIIPLIPPGSFFAELSEEQICRMLLLKYIKPATDITHIADRIYNESMVNRSWLAVHIRGSDKIYEYSDLMETHQKYHDAIKGFLYKYPNLGIFLLTDSAQLFEEYLKEYGDRIFCTTVNRTSVNVGLHLQGIHHGPTIGREVLVDVLLALKCDYFVGYAKSNVSVAIEHMKEWKPTDIFMLTAKPK